jgi:hypothetical protein
LTKGAFEKLGQSSALVEGQALTGDSFWSRVSGTPRPEKCSGETKERMKVASGSELGIDATRNSPAKDSNATGLHSSGWMKR